MRVKDNNGIIGVHKEVLYYHMFFTRFKNSKCQNFAKELNLFLSKYLL